MRKSLSAALLIFGLLVPQTAFAWNGKGHRMVAFIAYKNLTHDPQGPNARARVDQLLRNHPDFPLLAADLSPNDPNFGLKVFIKAATWPDIIKSDPRFFDETKTPPHPTPLKPGFPDMKMHKPFHYIDMPFTQDGSPVAQPVSPNALEVIPKIRNALGNPNVSQNIQAYGLSWLLHLVGDVHQPLHCTSRFTHKHGLPEGDRGGNLFTLQSTMVPEGNNPVRDLHTFWDDILGVNESFTAVQSLSNSIMAAIPPQLPIDVTEQHWINESFSLATTQVYTIGADEPNQPPPAVSVTYRNNATTTARRRVALAGYRLAEILNQKFH